MHYGAMANKLMKVRKSLPLSSTDLRDLELIRSAPQYQKQSEAAVLAEATRRGLQLMQDELSERGYAQIAQERVASRERRQATSRRRRPSWADED
ncbi:hypothetical protein SAMN05421595_2507 [Austwickia chelonae]|uniref:Uncharacterized protein n=2 Tax=Austwickia TaxID=1184606 RepID=K6UNS0_9MICO|nr:hypothetical protein AUCHE_21_00260 [Austwickia chelonae NBRC 105200]SEW37165.1 hypothetical protein SAMN05421595_2507 [Austwickia chelonae]